MAASEYLIRLFCSIKREKVQISKFVLGFQAQLYMENGWEKYIIMICISFI